jgi:hypothetical protein
VIVNPRYATPERERAPETAKADFCDGVSGLRYYNPTQGRWLSKDPIEENGGANLYAMAENNTINQADCFGLKSIIFNLFWDKTVKEEVQSLIDDIKMQMLKKIDDCKQLQQSKTCCGSDKWDFTFTATFNDQGLHSDLVPPVLEKTLVDYNDYDFRQMGNSGQNLINEFRTAKRDSAKQSPGYSGKSVTVILTTADLFDNDGTPGIGTTPSTGRGPLGIILNTNGNGLNFAHEMGHYTGYMPDPNDNDPTSPGHNKDPLNIMSKSFDLQNNRGGSKVDCQYCKGLSEYVNGTP